jgi:hypothetical protein
VKFSLQLVIAGWKGVVTSATLHTDNGSLTTTQLPSRLQPTRREDIADFFT